MIADIETLDLILSSGRIRAERSGPADASLVLCVHGLSANLRAFDVLRDALVPDRQVVAIDLRGRGCSEVTPAGSYGLDAHVEDIVEIAEELGIEQLDLVGWSMGALIGIRLAQARPGLLRRLVLLDHAGDMDEAALDAVKAGLARLDAVVPKPEVYVEAIRDKGVATPWGPFWEAFYRYELCERPDGTWTPQTDRTACTEDVENTEGDDFRARWSALTLPTLLVRATVPLNGGLIVPDDTLAALKEAVPGLENLDVDRNHFGIMDAPETIAAVQRFLG